MNLYASAGRQPLDLSVVATEPDYLRITRSTVRRGRWLSSFDADDKKQVCVLGSEAARTLFSYNGPLGQVLRIGEDWFRVVGVLGNGASYKEAGGDDINKHVFVPLAVARARYGDLSQKMQSGSFEILRIQLDSIAFQMADDGQVLPAARGMEAYLGKTHKVRDYELLIPMELIRQKAATQRIFTIVMGSIASISLLIGGIGIMNIMLANVSDRRKEIGTRRALGATRGNILAQFVLESATLTSLGGLMGIVVGYGLAVTVSHYAGWPTVVTPLSIGLGLGVSCCAGIVFGLWPAYQAAKVNSIEALRSN